GFIRKFILTRYFSLLGFSVFCFDGSHLFLLEPKQSPPLPILKAPFAPPPFSPLLSYPLSLSLSPAVISIPSVFFVFILWPPHRSQGQPRPATGWFADLGERNRLPVVQGCNL
ncbi:hypothetical protein MUK42_37693, partial [Musa troglodytarum]